jgi:hypothetical protein
MGLKCTYEGFMMLDECSVLCENCILVLYERQNDEQECQCRRSAVKIAVEHNSQQLFRLFEKWRKPGRLRL